MRAVWVPYLLAGLCLLFLALQCGWRLPRAELSASQKLADDLSRALNETSPIIMYPGLFAAREDFFKKGKVRKLKQEYELWNSSPDVTGWSPCMEAGPAYPPLSSASNGYLLVQANGGLNQQRMSVCNAVVIARLLNTTLVVPHFLYDSVWQDDSQSNDLFNQSHFIASLQSDIHITPSLPSHFNKTAIGIHVPKYAALEYYIQIAEPVLMKHGAVLLKSYMHGLAFDNVLHEAQKLRCRANYGALKMAPSLERLGQELVRRMASKGPFLAVHLRFEKDMVADTCCDYRGGEAERRDLEQYRQEHFSNMNAKFRKKGSPDELRRNGLCTLTPEEVGLLLAGLGYPNTTRVYVASDEIYGGERRLAAFKKLFPFSVSKASLASDTELAPFLNHKSQLAALDMFICTHADVFAYAHTGSNFPKIVSGLRMFDGQKMTIAPYKKKLARLFDIALTGPSKLSWRNFARQVQSMHRPRHLSKEFGKNVFREPIPDCMCRDKPP